MKPFAGKKRLFLCLSCIALAALTFPAFAADTGVVSKDAKAAEQRTPAVVSVPARESRVLLSSDIGGRIVSYEATAGFMPLFGEDEKEKASVFYVSYERTDDVPAQRERPVTFAFNGGPGSAALLLHLGAFGPKTLAFGDGGSARPEPPFDLVDNASSLLDVTDLVFIDPVETGYSRATEQKDVKSYLGVRQDATSVSEFIRLWLTSRGRSGSPLFLAGESYGGIRSGVLARLLQDKGMAPSGVILVSPVLSYGDIVPDSTNDRPYVLTLPTMAAAACYHGVIAPRLRGKPEEAVREATEWAENEYLRLLWKGSDLSSRDLDEGAKKLSELTGLSETTVRGASLRIDPEVFAGEALREKRLFTSLYDTRLVAPGNRYVFNEDPTMVLCGAPFVSSFLRYLSGTLQFSTNREYRSLNKTLSRQWDYQSGAEWQGNGLTNVVEELATAMRRDGGLRVFAALGRYDLVCCPDSVLYSLRQMDIPEDRKNNITTAWYEGGHMMYLNPAAKAKLKGDLVRFFEETLKR